MSRILYGIRQKKGHYMDPYSPPPFYPVSNSYKSNLNQEMEPVSSSTFNNISQILVLVIISLALIFFISGLLHLLVRFLKKRPAFSAIYDSNRFQDTSGSNHPLQRQLQQLFCLHDSGLDQATIDALPVFHYKDIMGLKEPFDCAVCLSELSDLDKLRLLPSCSHAFHIQCIDTWLLSNSSCPLCRDSLLSCNSITTNPFPNSRVPARQASTNQASTDEEERGDVKRVFSIRLGKYRSTNCNGEKGQEETSSANLDGRRCYSMGTYQYVLLDSDLQVALSDNNGGDGEGSGSVLDDHGDGEGKRIGGRSRGDSFSVSKIWLWSRKSKFPSPSSFLDDSSSFHVSLPINHKVEITRVV